MNGKYGDSLTKLKLIMRAPPAGNIHYDWPFPDFRKPQRWWNLKSKAMVFVVGLFGKVGLTWINNSKVYNKKVLIDAIFQRPKGTPLITVANHESCIDDPGLIGLVMSSRQLGDQKNMRWNLGAHDICYSKPLHGWFFSLGKVVPVIRGMGVYQKPVDFIIDRLNEGDWLHIFPEGRVNMEREELYRLKWGVGRIISECKNTPIVIPFWHTGMADVVPNHKPYYPRVRKTVVMNVGERINIEPVLKSVEDKSAVEKRKIITDVIQEELLKLRLTTLKLTEEVKTGKIF